MKWAESYRVIAEGSSSFTLVLTPPLSPPDWSSSVAASCFLSPSLSVALYVARPLLICVGGVGGAEEGGASAAHRLCKALLLLALRPRVILGTKRFFSPSAL